MYTDDIVITIKIEESLKQATKELTRTGEKIGLYINEEKIKCLILFKKQHMARKLETQNILFEMVDHFKYLGAWVNEKAKIH